MLIGNFALITGALNANKGEVISRIFKAKLLAKYLKQEGKNLHAFHFHMPYLPDIQTILSPQLQQLSLPNVELVDEDSALLLKFTSLQALNICLDELDKNKTKDLLLFTNLQQITIKTPNIPGNDQNSLPCEFRNFTHLRSLNLLDVHLHDPLVKEIVTLPQLEQLTMRCSRTSLIHLSILTNLTHLNLEDTLPSRAATSRQPMVSSEFVTSLTQLKTLRLSHYHLSTINALSSLTKLATLQLDDSYIEGEFPLFDKLTNLKELDLGVYYSQEIFNINFDSIRDLVFLTKLNLLGLYYNNDFDLETVSILTETISKLERLRSLGLTLYVFDKIILKPLQKLTNLTSLELHFKDTVIDQGELLLPWKKIIKLSFWKCTVDLEAMPALEEMKISKY